MPMVAPVNEPDPSRLRNSYAQQYGGDANISFAPMSYFAEKVKGNLTMTKHMPQTSESDAPRITPTMTARMPILKEMLLCNNLPTLPLATNYHHQSWSNDSSSSPEHHSGTPPTRAPQNPLDLLSTVSSHVARKENKNNNQRHANQYPYTGERNSAGLRHGRGIMTYPNGCRYNGCFVNDKRHGFGKCWYPNGCVYTGFWLDGKRDGVGKMVYADRGDVYEGEWMADRRHGRGLYYRSDYRVDVVRYMCHDVVGEGTQWSPNREFVVRLVDGVNRGPISVGQALEIGARIGIPDVPKQMQPEF